MSLRRPESCHLGEEPLLSCRAHSLHHLDTQCVAKACSGRPMAQAGSSSLLVKGPWATGMVLPSCSQVLAWTYLSSPLRILVGTRENVEV